MLVSNTQLYFILHIGVNDDNRVIDAVAWSSIPMASHVWILQPSEDTGAKAEDSFYYNQLLKRLLVTVNKLPERCTVVLTKTDKSVAISPNGQYGIIWFLAYVIFIFKVNVPHVQLLMNICRDPYHDRHQSSCCSD